MNALSAILAASVALALVGAATADAAKPEIVDGSDKIVLANADVTVWFHGKKPMLKVFPTGAEDAGFEFRFDRVLEFADADADGVADAGEARAFLNLADASGWQVETEVTETEAILALTLEAPLKLRGPQDVELPDLPQDQLRGNVTLTFHVFSEKQEIPLDNGTLPVETTMVKYDFAVNAWSWLDAANDRLALEGVVPAELVAAEGEGGATVATGDGDVGLVLWLDEAEATTDGVAEDVGVETTILEEEGQARLQHAFDAVGYDALLYDPVLGVASAAEATGEVDGLPGDLNPAPAAGLVGAVAAVGAVAVVRRR